MNRIMPSMAMALYFKLSWALLLFLCSIGPLFGSGAPSTESLETAALLALRAKLVDTDSRLQDWAGDDPCSSPWLGVTCGYQDSSNVSHVTELLLASLNLGGELAPELGNITYLTILNINGNHIQGSIPSSFGKLKQLRLLVVNNNLLSGEVAPELGFLPNLRRFQINDNQISGPIPSSFQNLTTLMHLHMSNNLLSGSIPSGLGQLKHLLHVLLDNNQISGPLPDDLTSIPSLTIVQLDDNALETTIPQSWGRSLSLLKLSLRSCGLTGIIPDLSGLRNMTYLDLSNNSLTGFSPDNLAQSILMIDISYNQLQGPIPNSYGQLNNLQALKLENNNFSGTVPASLGTAATFSNEDLLVNINLENNNLGDLVSGALYQAASIDRNLSIWLAGNPLCNRSAPDIQNAFCSRFANSTVASTLVPLYDRRSMTQCMCKSPEVQVPNTSECLCARPVTIVIELLSPGFPYFDSSYLARFTYFIAQMLSFSNSSQTVLLLSSDWKPGPRLETTLQLFPPAGAPWNQSDLDKLYDNLANYKLPVGLEIDPQHLIYGPYLLVLWGSIGVQSTGSSKGLTPGAVAGIVIACSVSTAVIMAVTILLFLRKRGWLLTSKGHKLMNRTKMMSGMNITGLKAFTFGELQTATQKFSQEIGEGGYGKVYKGILDDGQVVAVKRAHGGAMLVSRAFYTEIELLSRVHHKDLVSLIGFCDDEGEQMLVYEFMAGGTVRDHLAPSVSMHFTTRLMIALATARGLHYLHNYAKPPIYHRDIKAGNILLDRHFNAKVADFGLSKAKPTTQPGTDDKDHISTAVKGTPGYLDPMYFLTQKLTDKADVYSYGIVLMELITGLQPIYHGKNLAREVFLASNEGRMLDLVDPDMPSYPPTALDELVDLALSCCKDDPECRPSMGEVVRTLEDIQRMTEPWSISVELGDPALHASPEQFRLPNSPPQLSSEDVRGALRESIENLGGR